jgi:hypothetical protein
MSLFTRNLSHFFRSFYTRLTWSQLLRAGFPDGTVAVVNVAGEPTFVGGGMGPMSEITRKKVFCGAHLTRFQSKTLHYEQLLRPVCFRKHSPIYP